MTQRSQAHDEVVAGVTTTLLDYCDCVDENRPEDFAALFVEDGVFAEGDPALGRAHIEARFRKLLRPMTATTHHLSNIRVFPGEDGNTATARAHIYAWHQLADGNQFEIWGRYVDELRLEPDGRWRFVRREVQVAGAKGIEVSGLTRLPRRDV
ncbi:MAG: nuclear transport factor 2 family protein [Acidimicrobiales bacterium]